MNITTLIIIIAACIFLGVLIVEVVIGIQKEKQKYEEEELLRNFFPNVPDKKDKSVGGLSISEEKRGEEKHKNHSNFGGLSISEKKGHAEK